MLPDVDSLTGALPPGEHLADWDQVSEQFGWNLRRRRLLDGLGEGLAILARAGCGRVWLNGSFVTTKEEPADFDCVWGPIGVDLEVIREVGPELLTLAPVGPPSVEFLPNVTEAATGKQFASFFQTDRDGMPKGIVVLDPTKERWT